MAPKAPLDPLSALQIKKIIGILDFFMLVFKYIGEYVAGYRKEWVAGYRELELGFVCFFNPFPEQ